MIYDKIFGIKLPTSKNNAEVVVINRNLNKERKRYLATLDTYKPSDIKLI